jgi:hypothetical protein
MRYDVISYNHDDPMQYRSQSAHQVLSVGAGTPLPKAVYGYNSLKA